MGALVLGGVLLTACSGGSVTAPDATVSSAAAESVESSTLSCPAPGVVDTATAAGWTGYLAAHPDQVAVTIDDGRGNGLRHRGGDAQPAASAAKIVHLAAYARAVDAGTIDPEQLITVGEWERWYLPGLDGGAHPAALAELGVALDGRGLAAADPSTPVTLDDLAHAMIRFSDNAAADLLRDRLGDATLQSVVESVGGELPSGSAPVVELPSFLGAQIALLDSSGTSADGAADLAAAQRYATDEAERRRVQALPVPPIGTQLTWADGTPTASVDTLSAVAADLVAAADDPGRTGARLARTHLEWPPVPDGAVGLGAKGGSLPGVLTEVFVLRRDDGTVGRAALMVRGMDAQDWSTAVGSFAHQELLLDALQNPDTLAALRCGSSAR
ncbi:serine hydrolase [Nakamurella flava]|uniref:serine hydrolase n=1 Tax=Nakamurella flava TaxID=2576308 RepID=UPI00140C81AF|nr:serine hydrolase [Nakamurella flava]